MLHTLGGVPAGRSGETWMVVERSTYVLRAPAEATVRLGARALAWSPIHDGWLVPVSWWAAEQVISVFCAGVEERVSLRAEPDPDKLEGDEWAALLADLDAWWPSVTAGEEGGEHGGHAVGGVPLPLLAGALAGTARTLVDAAGVILRRPRLAARAFEDQRRLHTVRRADPGVVRWLGRHTAAARQLDWRAEQRDADPFVRLDATEDVVDHPANRFLAGQLRRVAVVLREAGGTLLARRPVEGELTDAVAWAHARGSRCNAAAAALTTLVGESWLGGLRSGEASEAALSVVRGDPAYRRVHRLCDAILRPRWSADAVASTPVRPTFSLYELWTFLWLAKALQARLGPGGWRRMSRLHTQTGSGAEWSVGDTRLIFNPPFRGWPPAHADQRHSLTGPRRPDLALLVGKTWFVLDAKYRVGRANLEDAFASVHIYRDALRWPSQGGAPRAGLLICPRVTPGTEDWFNPEFHARWGIGVVEARPGATPPVLPEVLG